MVAVAAIQSLLFTRLKYIGKIENISIDNKVFGLHYRLTTLVFLLFSIVVTCTHLLGETISCIPSSADKHEIKLINSYCWVEGTFTLPKALIRTIEFEFAHPGVSQHFEDKDEIIEHTYYQWVSTVLFLQAMAFYVTRALWKVSLSS